MKKTLALVLALLLIFSLALTSCSKKAEQPADNGNGTPTPEATQAPQGPKVLRLAGNEPPNLDPQLGTDQVSIQIDNEILEGLVRQYGSEIKPGMAEKWEVSPDGLTWTFHLRDAKWSDGVAVKAQDFEYSFKRLLNPETAAEYAYQGYYIVNGEEYNVGDVTDPNLIGVKALDDKTLEVKLDTPVTYFEQLMAFFSFLPSRQDVVEANKEAFGSAPDKMVYNGPFMLTEWNHDANVTLEKNPNYWDKDSIKLDKVEYTIVVDNSTVVNMYEAGDIDVAGLGPDYIDKYTQNGTIKYFYDGAEFYLQFNLKGQTPEVGKILQNADFRKAFAYAIDRQSYCDVVLKNGSAPATRYALPLLNGSTTDKLFVDEYPLDWFPKTADPAKAKEYMDKALAALGTTLDKLPAINFLTDDSADSRTAAEALQDMLLKNAGIKLQITQVQFKQRLEMMKAFQYDIVFAGWGPDYNDMMTYADLWVTGGGMNRTGWSNAKYDELIKTAKTNTDNKVRNDAMFESEKILLEESPIIPVYDRRRAYTAQDYFTGYVRNFIGPDLDYTYADILPH